MDRGMGKTRLRQFIEHESGALHGTLRYYLFRAGLANRGQSLDAAAQDLLQDTIAEALTHEDRFRVSGQPRAWLLGIAANLIRRRQIELRRREHREPLIRDLVPQAEDAMSEDELFDWLASLAAEDADELESDARAAAMLAAVSPEDAQVLRLAILNGFDGDSLAHELGVSPGAARVRLHRALNRLRLAHQKQEADDEKH